MLLVIVAGSNDVELLKVTCRFKSILIYLHRKNTCRLFIW